MTLRAGHQTPAVRRQALGSINLMVPSWPQSHASAMDTYLQGLFTLAHDGRGSGLFHFTLDTHNTRAHVCLCSFATRRDATRRAM